jgi:hypothetical protein
VACFSWELPWCDVLSERGELRGNYTRKSRERRTESGN